MSYIALYRKWRPDHFDEVKGQEAIVRTLRNQILYDRIAHAYLFCGTRGTGKTSIAKLFAKSVNCQNPQNGNPCNLCDSCKSINSGSSFDVLEIDAASNNGVDHIREIREQVQYPPVHGRYKIYIIDEVHMLSSGAFNALLKTLEEPPSYVIFILATTEKHKIPVTILSRCQKYDFKRISVDTISEHLQELMVKEEIPAEPKAIRYIARAADGSMRDALSLLDQCISFYLGETLTYENVLEVLGTVDNEIFKRLMDSIMKEDTIEVLHIIDEIINQGRELSQFLSDFLWYLRNLLLLQSDDNALNLDMSEESINALREEAGNIPSSTLLRFIRVLSELSGQLKSSSQKRVLLEIGFIKLCKPQMETRQDSLLERIRQLESKLEQGIPVTAVPSEPEVTKGKSSSVMVLNSTQALEERFAPAEAKDLKEIASSWSEIVEECPMPMQRFIKECRPTVSSASNLIQLFFEKDDIAKAYFEKNHQQNLHLLSDMISKKTQKEVKLECICADQANFSGGGLIDLSKIHYPITYE